MNKEGRNPWIRVLLSTGREVKLPETEPRAEPSPARDEGKSNVELWEQVWERENLTTALKRVESNGGAPGNDGMTVKDLRGYLKETVVGDQGSARKRRPISQAR